MKLFFLLTLIAVFISGSFEDLNFDHSASESISSTHAQQLDCHSGKNNQNHSERDEQSHCDDHFFHCLKICNALNFKHETNLLATSIMELNLFFPLHNHNTKNFGDSIYRPPISLS